MVRNKNCFRYAIYVNTEQYATNAKPPTPVPIVGGAETLAHIFGIHESRLNTSMCFIKTMQKQRLLFTKKVSANIFICG